MLAPGSPENDHDGLRPAAGELGSAVKAGAASADVILRKGDRGRYPFA